MRSLVLATLLIAAPGFAQSTSDQVSTAENAPSPPNETTVTNVAEPQPIIVRRDTPVELMATKEISTADVQPGDSFRLRLNKPIALQKDEVIPVGTWAYGQVLEAADSGGLGKSGKMLVQLSHLEFRGLKIPLDGKMAVEGSGAGSAGAAFIFSGVAGLFHRGNNAKIKAGEIVHSFVLEDIELPLASSSGSAQ